jgi:hypothetical protein
VLPFRSRRHVWRGLRAVAPALPVRPSCQARSNSTQRHRASRELSCPASCCGLARSVPASPCGCRRSLASPTCRELREKSMAERPTHAISTARPRNAATKREAQRGRRWRCPADSLGRRSGLLAVLELLRTARRGVDGVLRGHARPVAASPYGPREQDLGAAARRNAPPKGRYRGPVEPAGRAGSRGSGQHPPPREGLVQRRSLPRFSAVLRLPRSSAARQCSGQPRFAPGLEAGWRGNPRSAIRSHAPVAPSVAAPLAARL